MPRYIAQLGNTPALSLAELQAVFPDFQVTQLQSHTADFTAEDFDAQAAIERLGGTVKLFEVIKTFDHPNPDNIDQAIVEILSQQEGRITFAIGELGRDHLPTIEPSDIKELLQDHDHSVRYIEGSRTGLSAAVLLNKSVTELLVIQSESETVIARTLAVQDIDSWTQRDRHKPYADRKKGMLPPKVARMMVNLALGKDITADMTVLDPFCGSGTVLLEAATMGCSVIGSDLDEDAATGTRENLAWLANACNIDITSQVYHKDVSRLQLNQKVSHLVTEPFLGKPTPRAEQLPNIFKGLHKLYLGAFKQWTTLLKPGATVVIVFPEAVDADTNTRYTLEKLIDKLEDLGYTTSSESVLYHRPQATVQRSIHQFRFTGN